MNRQYYTNLADAAMADKAPSREQAGKILTNSSIEILPLLSAAFEVRKKFVGHSVTIHIINNAQNGFCPEDCHYCAQAKTSSADIADYPIKSDEEILAEAKNAYKKGAHRYCMVFAGRGPSSSRTEKLADLIRKIKSKYPIEVCVSAGLLDDAKAVTLKKAGLDRLNHNLNTSEKHYPEICTTHTFKDRLNTLSAARKAGLQLCSGVIAGMGEKEADLIDAAYILRDMKVESIPVNFLIPIKGNKLDKNPDLTPEYCLKLLCLYRFINPKAEIRIAAGRELHLRSMEVMALYAANSLFLDGYLNAQGSRRRETIQMIQDAGFTIESEIPITELLKNEQPATTKPSRNLPDSILMKGLKELRPFEPSKTS